MSFNRKNLTRPQKHDYLLRIYEQTRDHCENFETIYQYLLAGDCSDELIEEIYQTTETLSDQGHHNHIHQKQHHTQTLLQKIHQQEAQEKEHENPDSLLSAIEHHSGQ